MMTGNALTPDERRKLAEQIVHRLYNGWQTQKIEFALEEVEDAIIQFEKKEIER